MVLAINFLWITKRDAMCILYLIKNGDHVFCVEIMICEIFVVSPKLASDQDQEEQMAWK